MAVVGAGRLGGFHAQKIAARDDCELVAVVDPVAENRNRVAAECRTEARADCGELLDQVDAAVIAAPTRWHHRLALDFLRRRVHLLVEKPLSATAAEADELVEAAREKNVVLQVGHVERFNPAFTAAVSHARPPKYIEAVRASGFTFRSTDVGVVLDLMIHDLDLVLSLVRSPVRGVQALGLSVLGGHEDVANARLQFECGCVAALSASRVSYAAARQMHVWSQRGFAAIDFGARRATVVRPSETLLRRQFDVEALSPAQVEHYREHLNEEHLPREQFEFAAVDALSLELEDFVESIRTPRRPRVTGEAGRDAVAVAEQILECIRRHAWDDRAEGPVGPLAVPRPPRGAGVPPAVPEGPATPLPVPHPGVVPAPHFSPAPAALPVPRKEAG
jgi:predicted dehydrogenase